MNYTELLKDLRFEKNEKQEDIAKILKISRSSYSDYENKISVIPIKHLDKLCNHFDISVDYFLGLSKTKKYLNSRTIDRAISGQRIKELRKENKLTQKELAEQLHTVHPVITNYENGKNLIATPFLYTISKKYNVSADYLLGRIDSPKYLKN